MTKSTYFEYILPDGRIAKITFERLYEILKEKQNDLGFTPEDVANKATSFQETPDNIKYPSEKLVKDALDAKLEKSVHNNYTTLASLKLATGTTGSSAFCVETETLYQYLVLGSGYVANDKDVTITGNAGDTRWIAIAGKYRTGLATLLGYDNTDSGDNIQNNGLELDGASDIDKQILFKENGITHWAIQGGWRNEKAEFMYLYNLISGENLLAISQNGRWSINKPTNIIMESSAFQGNVLNDLIPSGIYDARITRGFNIEIDGAGTPDTFKWSVSTGGSFVEQANSVPITAGAIALDWGVEITFGATTGHTLGDKWAFRAHPQDALDTMTLKPPMLKYVYTYNGSLFYDKTYVASTTHCSLSSVFEVFQTTDYMLYLGNDSQFNSTNYILSSAGAGVTLVAEYWNGSTWVALTAVGESLIDETYNFTTDGSVKWDKNKFPLWAKTTVNGISAYWIRLKSSANPTSAPVINAITRHGSYRLAVYSAHNDVVRSFAVRGNGVTEMFEADRKSTSESFRLNEFITEGRMQTALESLVDKTTYFTTSDALADTLPASDFSKAQTIGATYTPVSLGTFIYGTAHGRNIIAGEKFSVYAYLQRNQTISSRPINFYVELWRYTSADVEVELIGTSNVISAPLNANIESYDFNIVVSAKTMDATDKLAVRILAQKPTVYTNNQIVTFWGGGTYESKLNYPSGSSNTSKLIYTSAKIDDYTLDLPDAFSMVDYDKGTAVTCTVPKNSVKAFQIGTVITVRQIGAGQLTIAPVDGDVILQYPDGLKISKRYGMATLLKVATDTWAVTGMLEA
jgi:hypothetical protein